MDAAGPTLGMGAGLPRASSTEANGLTGGLYLNIRKVDGRVDPQQQHARLPGALAVQLGVAVQARRARQPRQLDCGKVAGGAKPRGPMLDGESVWAGSPTASSGMQHASSANA